MARRVVAMARSMPDFVAISVRFHPDFSRIS